MHSVAIVATLGAGRTGLLKLHHQIREWEESVDLTGLDERALIELAQGGEHPAFRELVERYNTKAYWIAYNILHDHDTAEDIAQDAFVRVYKALGRFDIRKKFYTWLYQIVTNLCIDQLRRNRSRGKSVSIEDVGTVGAATSTPAAVLERDELRRRVRGTIKRLPPKYQAVLFLRDIEEMGCEDIAEIVGCSYATARWRIHHARRLFKELWEKRKG